MPSPVSNFGSTSPPPGGKEYSRTPRKVKLSASSHSRNCTASATSSTGSCGGLPRMSAMTSPTRARIGRQSSTLTRTSASACSIDGTRAARRASSSTRSVWIWMKLSRRAAPVGAPSPANPIRLPLVSRSIANTGCTTSRTSRPCSVNSPMIESSRNGMLSLTISRIDTVRRRSDPIGPPRDCMRTLAVPGGRSLRNSQASSASAATSRGS